MRASAALHRGQCHKNAGIRLTGLPTVMLGSLTHAHALTQGDTMRQSNRVAIGSRAMGTTSSRCHDTALVAACRLD